MLKIIENMHASSQLNVAHKAVGRIICLLQKNERRCIDNFCRGVSFLSFSFVHKITRLVCKNLLFLHWKETAI